MNKTAIIIGAGPAGLTAAYELLTKTEIKPIIIEKTNDIGGISKTVNFKGNRIDIGGHRFFSKSETVMKWWVDILPIQDNIKNNPEKNDNVMLIRKRLSRIFYLRKFFDYPVTVNLKTLSNLGFMRVVRIGWTYILIRMFPIKKVKSLEDFFINRFGKELYLTFFKDYTEKVWGVPCSQIEADWGAQRIKELSIFRALLHAVKSIFIKENSIEQKNTDTSLIEQFLYPKFGPGQLWEAVADKIVEKGGIIIKNSEVIGISFSESNINEIVYFNKTDDKSNVIRCDFLFSSMPVKDLIRSMGDSIPVKVKDAAFGLQYRDFITVGLLLNRLKVKKECKNMEDSRLINDNWIYIQEREVKVGRMQIFNNWSQYMALDNDKAWIGLEYFCNEGDELWNKSDAEFIDFAVKELVSIDIIDKSDFIDGTVIRVPKTYPAYFGTYKNFGNIREFTDRIENLFLIGRNGMHRYNNQDHSMLTAITAVNNIISGIMSKENIWDINIEEEYHEKK